jgi:hypothetical protein
MDKKADSNRKSSSEISFLPVTDGLGFHPFSDGLPYAPIGKSPTRGSGATVAGPPQISPTIRNKPSRPEAPIPQISVPVARPAPQVNSFETPRQPAIPGQFSTVHTPSVSHVPAATHATPQSILAHSLPPSLAQTLKEESFGLLYLMKRVIAYGLDFGFSLSLCFGALSSFVWIQDTGLDLLFHPSILILMAFTLISFHWFLVTLQEVLFKSTLGKRVFGLTLKGSRPVIFLRAVFFIPSFTFLGMGLLWSLFDRRGCCWHDRVVGIQPCEIARL